MDGKNIKHSTKTWSPFVTKQTPTGLGLSFASVLTAESSGFNATATWERNPLTHSEKTACHVQQFNRITTKVNQQKNHNGIYHVATSSASTATFQQQDLNLVAPGTPAAQPKTKQQEQRYGQSRSLALSSRTTNFQQQNLPLVAPMVPAAQSADVLPLLASIYDTRHAAPQAQSIQESNATVQSLYAKADCGVLHCATSHWHEPSTVKNSFTTLLNSYSPFAALSPLTQSILPQPSAATGTKTKYIDHDKEKQHPRQTLYLKELEYSDDRKKILGVGTSEVTISEEYSTTNSNYQPRTLISYKHTEVVVEDAVPDFTRHDIHTFGVALVHLRNDTCVGDGEYPHEFENRGRLPLRGKAPYHTFPLLPPGETYSGWQRPGPDRVILDGSYSFANIITHDSSVLGGFRLIC